MDPVYVTGEEAVQQMSADEPVMGLLYGGEARAGSIWALDRGICVRGKRKGEHLEPLPVTAAFWFAWSTFYPNTDIAP